MEPSSFSQTQRLFIPNHNDNLSTQQTAANFREIQRWGNSLLATKGWATGGTVFLTANGVLGYIDSKVEANGTYPLVGSSYMVPSGGDSPMTVVTGGEHNSSYSSSFSFSKPLTIQLASGYYYKLFWTLGISCPGVPVELVSTLLNTDIPSFSTTFQLTNLPIKTVDPATYDIVSANLITHIGNSQISTTSPQTYYCEQYGVTSGQSVTPNIVITNYNNPYNNKYQDQYEQSAMTVTGSLTVYYIPQTRKNGNF